MHVARPPARAQITARAANARAILDVLAQRGPRTRAQLIRDTELPRSSVSNALRQLDSRAVTVADRETRGSAGARVTLNPRLGFAAAVHIEHHDAHAALLDAGGVVRAEAHAPLSVAYDRVDVVSALIEECTAGVAPVHTAVVGMPGIVTRDGAIRDDTGPDGGVFRAALAERLGCPVRLENDVNLAALAELGGPLGADHTSFALLQLDSGLGAGLVLDGVLHRGASGVAGEVQYVPQTPLPLGAPVVGDVVTSDLARDAGLDPDLSLLAHLEAAGGGDEAAQRVVGEIARRIVVVAGTLTLVIDPGVFVLGGLAGHPVMVEAILAAARMYENLLVLRFEPSAFGREASLVGATAEAAADLRAGLAAGVAPHERRS